MALKIEKTRQWYESLYVKDAYRVYMLAKDDQD